MSVSNQFHKLRRPALMLATAACALSVGGCALDKRPARPANVTQDQLTAGSEPYFNAGPVTYQVQVSRELNPFDNDDVQYFAGLKTAQSIPRTDFWYGVWLWAKNQSGRNEMTADRFRLTDSAGNSYTPTQLSSNVNPYAWTSMQLLPNGIEPDANTAAGQAPNGGGLILFKLPTSVYSSRPLTLYVYAPGVAKPSVVSLDL